ncbi:MAG: hypothetical protein K6T29_04035 [Peptococcaceae bacterium]|nr:hypothetical protein [Peptococcaceae bacterium]
MQKLVRQILTETEEKIASWKDKLLKALGPNGQIVIELIPELELITCPQPPRPGLAFSRIAKPFPPRISEFFAHVRRRRTPPGVQAGVVVPVKVIGTTFTN